MNTITYSALTLREIAKYWAIEDSAGLHDLEERRRREILNQLETAWERGALKTDRDLAEINQLHNRMFKCFEGVIDDRISGQLVVMEQSRRSLIEGARVNFDDFRTWALTCGVNLPNFWSPNLIPGSPVPESGALMRNSGVHRGRGRRAFVRERVVEKIKHELKNLTLQREELRNFTRSQLARRYQCSGNAAMNARDLALKETDQ